MITIKDVASAAGVSATTVSNVIHGYQSRVSKETAEKIQAVIEELGYIPNMSARSLVSRSSHVIALVNHLPTDQPSDMILDPFYLRSIANIEDSMRESGYYLMLRTCRTKRDLVTFLQNWNADGLFVSGPLDDEFIDALTQSGKPVILLDGCPRAQELSYVTQDDYQGGVLAAKYLLDRGHTNIGYAATVANGESVLAERFRGFRETLAQAGVPLPEERTFLCDSHSITSSLALIEPVQRAVSGGMTALGACSDQLAIILSNELRKKGLSLPQQLSLIGFGDLPQSIICSPELTTIHYDVEQKASLAVSGMLNMLSADSPARIQVLLPVSITERSSVYRL